MDSAACNNIFTLPPWFLFLVIALIPAVAFYLRYRKFQEEMEEYRYWKNKRTEFGEEIEAVDLPDYHRFLTVEVFLALLAFGTALLGFLSTNNITYAFTVNQTCIVSQVMTPVPTVPPIATLPTVTPTTTHTPSGENTTEPTSTAIGTETPFPTQTIMPSVTHTDTATSTLTATATQTPTATVTATHTVTATNTPAATLFPSSTPPGSLGPGSTMLSDYNYWFAASLADGNWGLWQLDTVTGDMTPRNFGLPNNSPTTQAFQPAISPDGQQVAFTYGTTCANAPGCDRDLYIGNLASNTATRVTNSCGDEASPEWSPDGQFLAFHAHPISGCSDTLNGIYIINTNTNGLSQIVSGSFWNPTWSPDGQYIVFNGTNGIYGIQYASCAPTQNCSPWLIWRGVADAPDWIDTNTIVFAARIEADFELYTTDIVPGELSTNLTRITNNDFDDVHPTVPHTGRFISWQAFPYGEGNIGTAVEANADLYIMDLQSGDFTAQPLLIGNNINNFRDASLVRKSE